METWMYADCDLVQAGSGRTWTLLALDIDKLFIPSFNVIIISFFTKCIFNRGSYCERKYLDPTCIWEFKGENNLHRSSVKGLVIPNLGWSWGSPTRCNEQVQSILELNIPTADTSRKQGGVEAADRWLSEDLPGQARHSATKKRYSYFSFPVAS